MKLEYIQPVKLFYLPCSKNEIKIPDATEEDKLYYYRVRLYELLRKRMDLLKRRNNGNSTMCFLR